jgi:hypothetical protein
LQPSLLQSAEALHALPVRHFGAVAPPQSTSVSSPFFLPSVGLGAAHFPVLHTSLAQSPSILQTFPVSHLGAAAPPQSTSVSSPFFLPSLACGSRHAPAAVSHDALTQSASPLHPPPVPHLGADAPPQSTPVSSPSFLPSVADAGWQVPEAQLPLAQSGSPLQALPSTHFLAAGPPQSTSVSSPFFLPSASEGVVHLPPTQVRLLQSESWAHALSPSHGVAFGPPQSTSVSPSSLTPLVALAGRHLPAVHTDPAVHSALVVQSAAGVPPGMSSPVEQPARSARPKPADKSVFFMVQSSPGPGKASGQPIKLRDGGGAGNPW